jgi:enoyl-CoA hydratase/carnithine racemase
LVKAEDPIRFEDRGPYALLRINRPKQRNAINAAARLALSERLKQLNGSHKVIVLTGSGTSFCSGIDLKEYAATPDDLGVQDSLARDWINMLLAIRRHPAIVIAAVNGFALGGGSSLISVADLAVAADEAAIGMPEIEYGIYPSPAGPAAQLRLSPKHAAWLVLTGRRIDGKTAEHWGMVNLSVPLAHLEREVDTLARHIGQFDAIALAESKRAIDTVRGRTADWVGAFEFGTMVNTTIRQRSDAWNASLSRFRPS